MWTPRDRGFEQEKFLVPRHEEEGGGCADLHAIRMQAPLPGTHRDVNRAPLSPRGRCWTSLTTFTICDIDGPQNITWHSLGRSLTHDSQVPRHHHHHHHEVVVVVVIVFWGFFPAGLPAGDKLIKNSGKEG